MNINDYEIFYPGVYTPEEEAALEAVKAGKMGGPPAEFANRKKPVLERYALWEPCVLLYAACVNRFDPLYNDVEYAKSTWYGGLPVYPGYVNAENMVMLPPVFGNHAPRDGQIPGDAYDHEIQYYKPILAGDDITRGEPKVDIVDVTDKNGSPIRVFITIIETELVNQHGEVVGKSINRFPQMYARRKDGKPDEMRFDPHKSRVPYHYEQKDLELLKSYWEKEKIRGSETLYWEDVNVGEYLPATAEVPMTQMAMLRMHGMDFMNMSMQDLRDRLLTGNMEHMEYDEYGVPDTTMLHFRADQPGFYNFTGRNFCLRMVTNWMGDDGFVTKVNWRMVNDFPEDKQTNPFPEDFYRPSYFFKVPELKEKGARISTHGAAPDATITGGYIYDKRIENGEHLVDIACWGQDLEGHYHTECGITVRLPSKEK
ncbi:MAG: MaoC family dehydratase [Ruminococcaceae bacterium]|nr:MaoC family dehydratase [Oscillospiraceae bacterium]